MAPIYVAILIDDNIECLKALMPQLTFADKIVIVDGGTTDGSAEYVKSFNNVIYVENEWSFNFAKQRNVALEYCPIGSWVLSIDTDEIYTDDFLDNILELCKAYENDNVDRLMIPIYHMNTDLKHHNTAVGYELKMFRHFGGHYLNKTHEYYNGIFSGDIENMHPRCGIIHLKYLLDNKDKKRELYLNEKIYTRYQLDNIEYSPRVPIDKSIRFTIRNENLLKRLGDL